MHCDMYIVQKGLEHVEIQQDQREEHTNRECGRSNGGRGVGDNTCGQGVKKQKAFKVFFSLYLFTHLFLKGEVMWAKW